MSKIEVKTIEIIVGKKVIFLSPAELRELREVLDATFPREVVRYVPSAPIYIERPIYQHPWEYWQPYYTMSGNTLRLQTAAGNTTDANSDWQNLAK